MSISRKRSSNFTKLKPGREICRVFCFARGKKKLSEKSGKEVGHAAAFSAAWLLACRNMSLFSVLLRGKRTKDTLPPITAERRRWVRLTIASNRKANRAKPDLNRGRNKWFWRVFRPLKYPPAPHRLVFLSAWFALFTPRRGGSGFSIGAVARLAASRLRPCAWAINSALQRSAVPGFLFCSGSAASMLQYVFV